MSITFVRQRLIKKTLLAGFYKLGCKKIIAEVA